MPKATKKIIKMTFLKGKVYHLDHIYEFQAQVLPYAEPHREEGLSKYEPDLSDTYKMLKTVRIKIEVTIF